MKQIYLLATLGMLLISCKNDDDENNMASIVSNWKYIRSKWFQEATIILFCILKH